MLHSQADRQEGLFERAQDFINAARTGLSTIRGIEEVTHYFGKCVNTWLNLTDITLRGKHLFFPNIHSFLDAL